MYAEWLEKLGCEVGELLFYAMDIHSYVMTKSNLIYNKLIPSDCCLNSELLHPGSGLSLVFKHVNPWNFTASMMLIYPLCLYRLLMTSYCHKPSHASESIWNVDPRHVQGHPVS